MRKSRGRDGHKLIARQEESNWRWNWKWKDREKNKEIAGSGPRLHCRMSPIKIFTLVKTWWHFKMSCPSRHFLKLINLLCPSSVKVIQNILDSDLNLANWSSYKTNRIKWTLLGDDGQLDIKYIYEKLCKLQYISSMAFDDHHCSGKSTYSTRSNLMWSWKYGPKASPLILLQLTPVMRSGAPWQTAMCWLQEADGRDKKWC